MNKFRIYHENGDTNIFVSIIDGKETKEKLEFKFRPFMNKIHPYFVKQMQWIQHILKSQRIILNVNTVKTVYDMSKIKDDCFCELDKDNILILDNLEPSSDGNTYYLIQDEEMGRGWAALIKIDSRKNIEFIEQGHRDTVLEFLLDGDFIRSFEIDYEEELVNNLNEVYES